MSDADGEWPTTFQPHVEAILKEKPELRDRFRVVNQDGYAQFVEGLCDLVALQERDDCWNKREFDGDEQGERVIDGHVWAVHTNAWTCTYEVTVDEEPAEGPDFQYEFYQVFEMVDLGLWPLPDFVSIYKTKLARAKYALEAHDHYVMVAHEKRAELVAEVEEWEEKLRPPPPTPTGLEKKAALILSVIVRLDPKMNTKRREDLAVSLMGLPDEGLEEAVTARLTRGKSGSGPDLTG